MGGTAAKDTSGARVARHRVKVAGLGARRVEVSVPAGDVSLVKAVAGALRSGSVDADRVRAALQALVAPDQARSGAELVAFMRASPLAGEDLSFERDRSSGRAVELGPDGSWSIDTE